MMGAESALFRNGAIAAAGLGTGLEVLGGLRTMSDQSAAAGYNARVMESEARAIDRNTAAQVELMTREARRTMGRQRALFGISGFTPTGSLASIAQDSAEAATLDALAVRYGGQMQSTKARKAAAWTRQKADNAKPGGYLGIGTSLLAGVATTGKLTIGR